MSVSFSMNSDRHADGIWNRLDGIGRHPASGAGEDYLILLAIRLVLEEVEVNLENVKDIWSEGKNKIEEGGILLAGL